MADPDEKTSDKSSWRNPRHRRRETAEKLEEHFARVVFKLDSKEDGYKPEDRALKVTKLLTFMDERTDDAEVALQALEQFVKFCLRELTDKEMQPVRKAVRMFAEELRRNHQ